jgi:hypothetical protein
MPRFKNVPVHRSSQLRPTNERSQLKRKRPPANAGARQKRRRPSAEELGMHNSARRQEGNPINAVSQHSKSDPEETASDDSPISDQSDDSYSMQTPTQEEEASDQESFEKEPEFEDAKRIFSDTESPIRDSARVRQPKRNLAADTEGGPAREHSDTPASSHRGNTQKAAPQAPAPAPIRRRRARLHAQVKAKKKAPSTKSNYGGAYKAFRLDHRKLSKRSLNHQMYKTS